MNEELKSQIECVISDLSVMSMEPGDTASDAITIIRKLQALLDQPEVAAPKVMPNPPPSMNYLEAQAWKLGWYNGVYGRDPWDVQPQPQGGCT